MEPSQIIIVLAASVVVTLLLLIISTLNLRKIKLNQDKYHLELTAFDIRLNEIQILIREQANALSKVQEDQLSSQLETNQVSKQLEHRIKTLQDNFNEQKELIEIIQAQQPEDKLYSRAMKLVKLGAGVDEIMRECDIPRVEAEMLLAVHYKK